MTELRLIGLLGDEKQRFTECELVIERGIKTFVDVGSALLEIRDNRYYREGFATFEEYCRERWGFARSTAYQYIAAAEVVEDVRHGGQILPATERQARPLTSLEPEQRREAWITAVETAPDGKVTAAHVQSIVDSIKEPEKRPVSYHVSDDSYDWYTPIDCIEAARVVLGNIDLDPASSKAAQEAIKADVYYTKELDGLSQPWFGRVWLNPPYNMPLIEQFVERVVGGYESGEIDAAIVLTNNSTDTGWFHRLIDYPVCFTRGRLQFWNGDDRLATRQGQAIFYLGDNANLFSSIFGKFGVILKKYDNREY